MFSTPTVAPHSDPLTWFAEAFAAAQVGEPFDASRAALATVATDGRPSVRYVLVKGVDARGFAFFTNYRSPKAHHLEARPAAALAFHWASTGVQVRVEGDVAKLPVAESDAYFTSRPRGSQLGAWASEQSEPIADRSALEHQVAAVTERFGDGPVARPSFWGGYRIVPTRVEFWLNRDDRLHDRFSYESRADGWSVERLQP